jgi:peptidyl-prolyl cis-trans isomerase C
MKSCILSLLISSFSFAQTAPGSTPQQTPAGTQAPASGQSPASGQAPAGRKGAGPGQEQLKVRGPVAIAQQDPNRVVATINGQKVTATQALKYLQAMPANDLQRFQQSGGGLSTALQQILMMRHLSELATQQHLDQQDPIKQQLEFSREQLLAQAYLNQVSNSASPSAEETKSYYDSHSQNFQEAKLSAIIVSFTPAGAAPNTPGARTEEQARAKSDEVVKKLRGGANFADLAKTDSDHKPSAEKGGELGSFSPDRLPKEISDPVFKLKVGDIADPIREPSGFYIIKLDSLNKKTFEQSQNDIVAQLKNEQVRKLLDQQNQQFQIQVEDREFFNLGTPTSSTTPAPSHPSPGQPKANSNQ